MKASFRDFKSDPSLPMTTPLLTLRHAVETFAVSSAECERGFSKMNAIVTPLRSLLRIENVSSLMFINIVGPPLASWDPTKFVRKWVARRRSAEHLACKKRQTNTEVFAYQPLWEVMKL